METAEDIWKSSSDLSNLIFPEKRKFSVLVSPLKPVGWKNIEGDALIADKYWSIDLPIHLQCFQEAKHDVRDNSEKAQRIHFRRHARKRRSNRIQLNPSSPADQFPVVTCFGGRNSDTNETVLKGTHSEILSSETLGTYHERRGGGTADKDKQEESTKSTKSRPQNWRAQRTEEQKQAALEKRSQAYAKMPAEEKKAVLQKRRQANADMSAVKKARSQKKREVYAEEKACTH